MKGGGVSRGEADCICRVSGFIPNNKSKPG